MGKGFLPAVQSLQFGGDLTRTPSWHDDRAVLFWRLAKMDREARNVTNAADNDLSRMAQALETSGDYRPGHGGLSAHSETVSSGSGRSPSRQTWPSLSAPSKLN